MTVSFTLSHRVRAIKPSPTLAVGAKAAELKAKGKDIIDLGVGEPDFATPAPICEAAISAIQSGFTKYTAVDGIMPLKQAIVDKLKHDNQLEYALNQILVSCGGKQSFFNLCQALLNPGDEVIIPAPYWVSYPDMVILAGAKPVIIESDIHTHYKITPSQLANAITSRTRLIVINSPSNPSGKVYSKQELHALAKVIKEHPQILVASDDMYERILWTKEPFYNVVMADPDLYAQTIVLNGVSKAYAMTGWRIGYAAGPKEVITAMKNIQSQSTSNPASISQAAALAALKGDQSSVTQMCEAFKERHDFLFEALSKLPGVRCLPSDGTFYSFPDISECIQRKGLGDDVAFCDYLLNDVGLAAVPGSAFGNPGCIRFSFAASMDVLKEAMTRFAKAVKN